MSSIQRLTSIVALIAASAAPALPSIFEEVSDGIYVVRDDSGQWAGDMSKGITHQNRAEYQAKKLLDLSGVPEDVWRQAKQVRLSAFFSVRDYSWHSGPKENGLDEAFEVVVNGVVNTYPTNCGAPAWKNGREPAFGWYDFVLPKEQFKRGVNEIILRKAPSEKNDDYLYLCIDLSVKPVNSYVAFSGDQWTQEKLTVPGGNGEYMVRVYLITKDMRVNVTWRPGKEPELEDPAKLIAYHGSRDGQVTPDGLELSPGQSARMEWHEAALDQMTALKAAVEASGDVQFAWLDENDKPVEAKRGAAPFTAELPAGRALRPSGLVISPAGDKAVITKVSIEGALALRPVPEPVDMAPHIAEPAGKPAERVRRCEIRGDAVLLENASLRCRFTTSDDRLRLASLYNEWTASEMARHPDQVWLFLVEVSGVRYAGSKDFRLKSLRLTKEGFRAELVLPDPAIQATLRVGIQDEGLRMGLDLTNAGTESLDFKLAFPHLAGLAASDSPEDDYYFFPWGGGIFSDTPAIIRRGYGDHEAFYQIMDLFSPERGGGLCVRADDDEGWHKVLALRKHVPGRAEFGGEKLSMHVTDEYKWANPLDDVEGVGFAYEYLRRTRGPGEGFSPADAVIAAHPGDWRVAMRAYADWAHRAWKFRPYPSRLRRVENMIAAGWGQSPLFRDGAYRRDFIRPNTDCIELMSWWEWSKLGPWRTPWDKLKERIGEWAYNRYKAYWVKDPVTGKLMYPLTRGDYDGYNERWGGLPAFRKAIATYKKMGALVTLYTDPILADDNTKLGQKYGKLWGVVDAKGEYVENYMSWNMCHDVAEYREYVARTMERVMRETGADGIRLDEYGHRGFVCYNKLHKHTFAEPGITQWQKAIAETTKMVHERMDRVNPKAVLTTEHPGYDYLMQYIEGCITYDLTVQATPLRPLEVNLQRFYFPECKPYELDHRGADRQHRKRFWNGVASFGSYYPPNMYAILRENSGAFEGRDCEALIPTLERRVYANRFGNGDKAIYTLYNATGHTFDGPALRLEAPTGSHVFDMLNCEPCDVEDGAVRVYLPRDGVACVAVLRERLNVRRAGDALVVDAKPGKKRARLVVCDRDGQELLSAPVKAGTNAIELGGLPADTEPACVKLLASETLMDIAAAPTVSGR